MSNRGAGGGKTKALTSLCGSGFDVLKYCKDPRTKVCKERKHKGSQTILAITSTTSLRTRALNLVFSPS